MPQYDIAVIGSGPGGYVAALRAAAQMADLAILYDLSVVQSEVLGNRQGLLLRGHV